jgi:ABC-type Mn2+/Zn2+ transport system permease subunit
MEYLGIVLWIGLAFLPAFAARREGYSFWAYLILSLLDSPLIGWGTLSVARSLDRPQPGPSIAGGA